MTTPEYTATLSPKALRRGLSNLVGIALLGASSINMAADPITLKLWSLTNENYPEFVELAATAFKEQYPHVSVELESIANEAYKTALQVGLVGSEPPDVFFNWSGEDAARLARSGLAMDITELGAQDGMYQTLVSDSWQQAFTVDGKQYGVPTEAVSKYFYYNTKYFDEHGLSIPTTFNELLGLCGKIREIDAETVPMPLGNSERWKLNHYITVINERTLGMDALRADYALTSDDDVLFNNPGYVEAWNNVLKLQQANCFQDAPNATSPEVSRSLFSAEISPMIFCGTWCMSIFDGEGFKDYALFRFPPIEGAGSDGSTNMVVPQGLQISAKTAYPEEAVAFASFLVNAEMGKLYTEMLGSIPSNAELVSETQATEQFKWVADDVASLSEAYNVLDVLLEANVAEAYLDMGTEILNGTKTPEEAMAKIRDTALASKKAMASK